MFSWYNFQIYYYYYYYHHHHHHHYHQGLSQATPGVFKIGLGTKHLLGVASGNTDMSVYSRDRCNVT
jgi:hypothetical protein